MSTEKTAKVAIFLRVSPELKVAWIKMCADRGVKQTLAGERLAEWILSTVPSLQAHILTNAPLNDQALEEIATALAGRQLEKESARLKGIHKINREKRSPSSAARDGRESSKTP